MYTTIAPLPMFSNVWSSCQCFCTGRSTFCQQRVEFRALLAELVEGGGLTGLATETGSWPGNVVGRSSGSPAVITCMTAWELWPGLWHQWSCGQDYDSRGAVARIMTAVKLWPGLWQQGSCGQDCDSSEAVARIMTAVKLWPGLWQKGSCGQDYDSSEAVARVMTAVALALSCFILHDDHYQTLQLTIICY